MSDKENIKKCIFCNFIIIIIFIFTIIYNNNTSLKIGYSDTLIILGIKINDIYKYILLQLNIFLIEFIYELTYEYANPKLYFLVYNDDKKDIEDFSRFELQFYSQFLWFLTSIKNGLMLLISVSQIDLILSKIIYNEIAYIIVVKTILKKKNFIDKKNYVIFNDKIEK